jgi:16S rRNA G1207 methylase RsmC
MAEQLVRVFRANRPLEPGEAVRLLQSLARLGSTAAKQWVHGEGFKWLNDELFRNLQRMRSRQLTQVCWSMANLAPTWIPTDVFLEILCSSVRRQLKNFDPMGLTQVVWSHSKMNREVPGFLLPHVLTATKKNMHQFNTQDCTNMLWALARSTPSKQKLQVAQSLLTRAASLSHQLKHVEIANVCWAAGQLELHVPTADQAKLCMAIQRISKALTPQHLAMVLHGSVVIHWDEDTVAVVEARLSATLSMFGPRSTANALEGCVRAMEHSEDGKSQRDIAHALLRRSQETMSMFDSRDVTSLSSCLEKYQAASNDNVDTLLVQTLTERFVDVCAEASSIDLSRTFRALVVLGATFSPPQVRAVQDCFFSNSLAHCSVKDVLHILWAHAHGELTLPWNLSRKLQEKCLEMLGEFTSQGLSTMLWGFAKLSARGGALISTFEGRVQAESLSKTWSAQELATALWASATLKLTAVFSSLCHGHIAAVLADMNGTDVGNTLWGLATLYGDDEDGKNAFEEAIGMVKDRLRDKSLVDAMTAGQLVYTCWACSKLRTAGMEGDVFPDQVLMCTAIAKAIDTMHAQNLGMLAWGLTAGKVRYCDSTKLTRHIVRKCRDCCEDMTWQTVAHVEYFLRSTDKLDLSSKHRKLLVSMRARMVRLHEQMCRDNKSVEKECEASLLSILKQEAGNDREHDLLTVDSSKGFVKRAAKRFKQVYRWHRFSQKEAAGTPWIDQQAHNAGFVVVRFNKYATSFGMILAALESHATPGAKMFVYGTHEEGISALPARLSASSNWSSISMHGTVVKATLRSSRKNPVVLKKTFRNKVDLCMVQVDGTEVVTEGRWIVYPGLFSGGGMDIMTAYMIKILLTNWWKKRDSGKSLDCLDFCCGSGVIARTVMNWSRGCVTMDALDADALAILAARKNLKGCRQLFLSDGWRSVQPDIRWDCILSNPPVHDLHGRDSFQVLHGLLKGALRRLHYGGSLWVVTQNYIPVGAMVEEEDWAQWDTMDCFSDGRFSVWKFVRSQEEVPVSRGQKKRQKPEEDGTNCESKRRKTADPEVLSIKKQKKKDKKTRVSLAVCS